MKRSTLWILSGVAVAALLAGGARWASLRKTAVETTKTSSPVTNQIELSASDVIEAQKMDMVLGLPVSGTLKASQSAMVKARVAGELMDLVVREGDLVKAGQLIARIDPTEYQARERQAKQQADAAQAQVEIAQKQFDNNKALVDQGFISQTALQTSAASLNGAKATHMAALAALDVTRKALEDASIRSPISGQIAQRLAQPGERMAVDARIVEVVNLSQLELEAALPAADASLVRNGMKAQLKIEGMEEPVSAKVLRINPAAQAGSRSVLVYLGLAGQGGLRQGLFAEGSLGTRTVQALAVPLSSVRTDKPQAYVQVVDGGQVRHVTVQTGARTERTLKNTTLTWVEVQGLTEGAQVLTASAGAVREGTPVKFTAGVR
ncbi:efflux RND transporter periplasmic adaptor subunit [Limnohabitans sp. T6-20]|uniref:efflux RND transporter periplasmic adaptor subunit n=1 Tax=Limnohabitans sp. T6-20 TaxID=1100725 RepID=UPI000D3AAFC4|nr:efflux RND transporter periplasmic adaptor subunit [Limnohabitans sp. T6-20]PUE09983.1 efflux transporter periplasmic adaptor subunit [Limnohabitans sp. T6-20]